MYKKTDRKVTGLKELFELLFAGEVVCFTVSDSLLVLYRYSDTLEMLGYSNDLSGRQWGTVPLYNASIAITYSRASRSSVFVCEEEKWYDNLPPQGVLCWINGEKKKIRLVIGYDAESAKYNTTVGFVYHAEPLTLEEVKQYILECQPGDR